MGNAHERLFEIALVTERPTKALTEAVEALLTAGNSRDELLAELESFRQHLQQQDRDTDEDRVLEVMDFLVGWSSPHMKIGAHGLPTGTVKASPSIPPYVPLPTVRVIFPGTSGGVWTDRAEAARYRDLFFPPTVASEWTIGVLDLTGMLPTPGVLQDLLLPLAQRVRGGMYGQLVLVVRTHDAGVADFLRYLSKEYSLPMFLSPAFEALSSAQPIGALTSTEHTTLNVLAGMGGAVTASQLAQAVNIEPTAAGNRLVGLASKGFLHRLPSQHSRADLFVDFRAFTGLAPSKLRVDWTTVAVAA